MKKAKQPPYYANAGNKGYRIVLTVFTFLVIYIVCMLIAIGEDDTELLIGFAVSQTALYVAWLVLLIGRIIYMRKNSLRPAPIKAIKGFFMWWWRFLALYRAKFRPAPADRNELERQLTSFNEDYTGFYAGKALNDNTTQYYRNLLILHYRRLKQLGLRFEPKQTRMVLEDGPAVRTKIAQDGKLWHTQADEHCILSGSYFSGSRRIFRRRAAGCMHYDIIGAKGGGVTVHCPNCGNVAQMDAFIDGCPYCGGKYMLNELSDRISNRHFYRDPAAELKKARIKISAWANRLVFAFTLIEFIACVCSFWPSALNSSGSQLPFAIALTVMSMMMLFGVLFVAMRVIIAPFKLLIRLLYTKLREKHSQEMQLARRNEEKLALVHRFNRDFSLNAFFGNIQNKLAAIHYAEAHRQVGVFAGLDLSPFIAQYSDVADCEFESMELLSYEHRGNIEAAQVAASLRLMYWRQGKLSFRREQVELRLEKATVRDDKHPFGIYIPKCGKCYSSVDLLNGNVCAYCGTVLDASRLDWCITAYDSKL